MNKTQGTHLRKIAISSSHLDLLDNIFTKINLIIKGKRDVMYSDIINLISRQNYTGKLSNEIMLWCNYNIRQGKYFVAIQDLLG